MNSHWRSLELISAALQRLYRPGSWVALGRQKFTPNYSMFNFQVTWWLFWGTSLIHQHLSWAPYFCWDWKFTQSLLNQISILVLLGQAPWPRHSLTEWERSKTVLEQGFQGKPLLCGQDKKHWARRQMYYFSGTQVLSVHIHVSLNGKRTLEWAEKFGEKKKKKPANSGHVQTN